jgi:7,8-dihydropterin-6-yl-methyl-4-(beta-D-ribofuranosyl)aminobenzene 5'-phosphate synthase
MSKNLHINVLIDNAAQSAAFKTEHGFSLWIEYQKKIVLFDLGHTDAIFHNAKMLGLDLAQVDAIVLSHGHYDHTGQLKDVVQASSKARIFVHPQATIERFSKKATEIKFIGMSDGDHWALKHLDGKGRVIWTSQPTEVFPGVLVSGEIPRDTDFEDVGGAFFRDGHCVDPDHIWDDQALIIQCGGGSVVISGCAHSGIINILTYCKTLASPQKIKAFVGGMHLLNASEGRIGHTIDMIQNLGVEEIFAGHCTGAHALEKLAQAFGSRLAILRAGIEITLK